MTSVALMLFAVPVKAATGPHMVKDINTSGSSNPSDLTAMNGIVYFSAKGGGKGDELWRSDGTANGTYRVKDIRKGPAGSGPYGLAAIDGLLYFVADDGVHGSELWVSNGTGPGTRLVKDIIPGSASSRPYGFTEYNGVVYFSAGDYALGSELWRTDGTASGTYRLTNLKSGPNGGVDGFTPFAGKLFFVIHDEYGFGTLYRSDGTAAGTKPFKNSSGHQVKGYLALQPTVVGSVMYFTRDTPDQGDWTGELWRTKGTAATTRKIADLDASLITEVGGTAYFRTYEVIADSYVGHLWKSNGSASTTFLVRDFNEFDNDVPGESLFRAAGGGLIFDAQSDNGQLWFSDGTSAGTQSLNVPVGPAGESAVLGSVAYFTGSPTDSSDAVGANDCAFSCYALWRSDGTTVGTYPIGGPESDWNELTVVGNSIYFVGDANGHGSELWRYVP